MANKQQTLQTNIVLGGKVSKSFDQIGTKLEEVGTTVNKVSQLLIKAGTEGVKTYMEYEEAMKEIASLQEYSYEDLEKLHKLNKETAQSTIYTNTELANAELLLAQAGLKIEDVTKILPSTLRLATAGNLDMADSVDYLTSSLNSLGLSMDYAGTLTDQMAKTAALGMTDIDTLGESLTRLGSAAGQYFKGGSSEILTILSAMSQFGKDMRGSEAGTQLRNFAISLAAPASNVEEMAEAMRELGYAEEEVEEYINGRSNGQAARAIETLKEAGLQIYDANDELLPMIDIIKSLRNAVYGSSTYTEDLSEFGEAFAKTGSDVDKFVESTDGLSDNALFTLMTQIFGKRTATTALNLISISDEEWDTTLQEIEDSAGYAEDAADIMQGGLTGALRQLETAFTELKTTLGEHLAPDVENVANFLHNIVTDISNIDGDTWDAVVAGMEVVAGAGPGILLVSGAFKLLSKIMTPGAGIALGITAAVAGLRAMGELSEQDMENNFGDMSLDATTLREHIEKLGDAFDDSYADINNFNAALEKSVEDYKTASSTFSGTLLTAMLTNATLTEDDQLKLQNLGNDMYNSVVEGIGNSTAQTTTFLEMLFGGEGTAEYNGDYQDLLDLTNQSYLNALAAAEEIGNGLRDAMNKAFEDGQVSDEEYQNILSYVDSYNAAVIKAQNEAADRQEYIDQQKLLHKAQTASLDEIQSMATEIETARNSRLGQLEEDYYNQYYATSYDWDQAIRNGTLVDGEVATEERKAASLAAMAEAYEQKKSSTGASYDSILQRLWQSQLEQSDLGDAYNFLANLSSMVLNGETTMDAAIEDMKAAGFGKNVNAGEGGRLRYGTDTRTQLSNALTYMAESFGGYEGIAEKAEYYTGIGDEEMANFFTALYTMRMINDNYSKVTLRGNDWISSAATWLTGSDIQSVSDSTGILSELTQEDAYNEFIANIQVTDNGEGEELREKLGQTFSEPIQQSVRITYGSTDVRGSTDAYGAFRNTNYMNAYSKYAEGGRADTASIFGEAGAEWAIPEEHSARTAALLDAARAASGFTWPELLSMAGGLNAGGGNSVTLAYSPTIYATDATDVENKLIQDKSRMERWLRERELRREVEVYA